jgi:hypothetical protein
VFVVDIDKAKVQFVGDGAVDRGRDEEYVLKKEGNAQLEDMHQCFMGFIHEGVIDLPGYNLGENLFLGVQSMFDHCWDKLDFKVWVLGLQGRLDNAVHVVTVMQACIHVADESNTNDILGGGEGVGLDPDLVVAKLNE